uniref:EF-hand domain-containing protein n=1 Tax=Strigamia maritima TaxID=126957 RepID=T1JEQ1_STRMM
TVDQIFNLANVYRIITRGSKGALDRQLFRDDLYKRFHMTDEFLLDRNYNSINFIAVFRVFDKDNDAYVSLEEWIVGMSVLLLGTDAELVKFCFAVFNLTTDTSFGRDEMFQLLRTAITRFNTDEDPDEGVRDLIELVLRKMDHDQDGRINFEDFEMSVKKDHLYLEIFGNCLPFPEYAEQFLEQLSVVVDEY